MMRGSIQINARQIKAARALLDWSQDDLSQASELSIATIRNIESGQLSPRQSTYDQIQKAFENAGLEFIHPQGVRQRPQEITILEGDAGTRAFYDDVYHYANSVGGDLIVVCPDPDAIYLKDDYKALHIDRMCALIGRATVKCLITNDRISTPAAAYCEYRYMPEKHISSIPFYVYGTKCSFRVNMQSGVPRIILIDSPELANAFYEQFYSLWEIATPIDTAALKRDKT